MLDLNTYTAKDVIASALANHADAFRRALLEQADMHDAYAAAVSRSPATRAAIQAMAKACRQASVLIESGLPDLEVRTGIFVCAFNAASALQGISLPQRKAIMVRTVAQ